MVGVEFVEQARAVLWSQGLSMRDTQSEHVPTTLAAELKDLLGTFLQYDMGLEMPRPSSSLSPLDMLHRKHDRFLSLLAEIREVPGLERFMLGNLFDDLCRSLPETPVVVLVAGLRECHAVALSRSRMLAHIRLAGITMNDVWELAVRVRNTDSNVRAMRHEPGEIRGLDMPTEAEKAFRKLWRKVVKPVFNVLGLKVCLSDALRKTG
jgi:hypothetical protein